MPEAVRMLRKPLYFESGNEPVLKIVHAPICRWKVMNEIRVRVGSGLPRVFHVPVGFITDLASIPWFVPIGFIDNRIQIAAILHDYFYKVIERSGWPVYDISRKEADYLFWMAMVQNGVPKYKAWTCWAAVRMFGWLGWKRQVV